MTTTVDVSREELLARAEALVPSLAERAAATEAARRVSAETIAELVEAGLFRITTPRKWGGSGLGYDTAWEVSTVLGRGCGSTAWCFMVAAVHNWQMGIAPELAQEEYFTTPDQIASSAPVGGTLEPADGGWIISGRWPFSSGVDNAKWIMPCAFTPEHGLVMLMVPRSAIRIDDDWHVSGLRGTGSKSVVIDEPLFVPGHRYTPFVGRTYPEARDAQGVPLYGAPLLSVLPHTLAGPVIGMTLGMVEAFVEGMKVRRTPMGQSQAELAVQHMRVAEASAMVEAARAVARANLAELKERGAGDAGFSDLDRVRFRRDHAFIAKLCVGAANTLFEGSGGSALYETSPLQRFHRDIHAGTHQIGLDWDVAGELYGRARFGLELSPGIW